MVSYGKTVASFAGLADAVSRRVGSSGHTAGAINRMAGTFCRMPEPSDRTAGGSDRMAATICRTAAIPDHPVSTFCHPVGSGCHPVGASDLTAESFYRTRKAFYRMAESFYRAVFRQKHAQTGKNHLFSPSSPARCAKNDSCSVRPVAEPVEPQARRYNLPRSISRSQIKTMIQNEK